MNDEFVIPEQDIYGVVPYASSLYFKSDATLKQARVYTQLGEILKILGRTKSAYNNLSTAYFYVCQAEEGEKSRFPYQELATTKEYGTILFYVRAFKESEAHLRKAGRICQKLQEDGKLNSQLLEKYQTEIHSLIF